MKMEHIEVTVGNATKASNGLQTTNATTTLSEKKNAIRNRLGKMTCDLLASWQQLFKRFAFQMFVLFLLASSLQVAQAQCATTWTSRTSAADNTWNSVTYGNGLYVAVASTGAGNRVMTSPDGVTWTSRSSAADNSWTSVTYGNGLFVATASSGTGNRVMTSPDGINWTSRTSAADNSWLGVTYGNGLFVAVAWDGTNRVMTSPDGITWTSRTSAAANGWTAITYGNGVFVAVANTGTGNRVMTSPDGITWTSSTTAVNNNWCGVTYGNGVFVAVAPTGTGNRVMTSPDGITWTSRSSAVDNGWTSVTYGNGLFVAVSLTGTGNRVMTSPDGITWTSRSSAVDNGWQFVGYGNNLFVAVSLNGTGNRVMTSSPFNKATAASTTPTLCINTALTNITHTTTGATGIGTATGLPAGVTAAWASNTITISGTPTASGTFSYSIPLTSGCGTVNATGTITVTPANTVSAASSTANLCINTALTNITHSTTGATGIGTATGLPTGVTAAWATNTITISGTPTAAGTFNYSIPLIGGCGTVNATGTITVNASPAAPTTANNGFVCGSGSTTISATPASNCTIDWYGLSSTPSVNYSNDFNSAALNGATISGNASVISNGLVLTQNLAAQFGGFTIPSSGVNANKYNISFKMTNGGGGGADGMSYSFADDASATATTPLPENGTGTKLAICFDDWTCCGNTTGVPGIRVLYNSNSSTELSSTVGVQGVLGYSSNTSWIGMSNVPVVATISETGLMNLTVNGQAIFTNLQLPAGYLSADKSSWKHVFKARTGGSFMLHAIDDISILGYPFNLLASGSSTFTTPSIASTTSYYALSRNLTSGCVSNTNLSVLTTVNPLPTLSASSGGASAVCVNATTPAFNNAQSGGTWSIVPGTGTASVSLGGAVTGLTAGTVSVVYTYNNGTCSNSVSSSVTVNLNTAGAASSTPTLCINNALTNITHTTTGATGIGIATGLPTGVTAAWAANTITISGTPTASGTFNYSIPLTGGCGTVNAIGSITVTPNMTAGVASSTPTLVINTSLTNITHSTTGATGIGAATGLPTGVTATWASNTVTIIGTPTAVGTFSYTIPLTGGCGTTNATGTIKVTGPVLYLNTFDAITSCTAQVNTPMMATGATGTALTRSTVTCNAGSGIFISTTLNVTSSVNNSSYIEFSASTSGNKKLNITGLYFFRQASSAAPNQLEVRYSTDGFVTSTSWAAAPNSPISGSGITWDFTDFTTAVNGTVTFRLYPYGTQRADGAITAVSAAGTFRVDDVTIYGNVVYGPTAATIATMGPSVVCPGTSSAITAAINGGTAPYTLVYTDGTSNTNVTNYQSGTAIIVTPTATKNYTLVSVTDANVILLNTNMTGTATLTVLTVSTASSTPTLCINTPLININHTTEGATGIGTATGLPAGVTAAWANNTITISGTPTEAETFTYSIPLTGGCGSVNAAGTITVTPNMTAGTASSTPILCINTALTNITHITTGVTGIGTAAGLPAGVAAAWANNTISITGTPSEAGTFSYSIPLTGGCGTVNATGTIVVFETPSITIIADPGNSITTGTAVTFTAFPTNGGSTPAYQWKKNGDNVGTNSFTYTDLTLVNGDVIACLLSNNTYTSPATATSNSIIMEVSHCPVGTNWTIRTSATDNDWRSVTYGNGLFVAVAATGTGNLVMTSPDGITWTIRSSAADNQWTAITYGNGLFVAVSSTGNGNRVMTSPDGILWSVRSSAADNSWSSVTYGNGMFVAVAKSGSNNRVMTSPNGITWTSRISAADNGWQSVTYGNGIFLAVASDFSSNSVMTSSDGIIWAIRTPPSTNVSWTAVTYGNGLFVAVGDWSSGNGVMTSPNGITWTIRASAADNNWRSVTYGSNIFVAVAQTGASNRIMTSSNGITWTSRTSGVDNQWQSVTYGNGLFVAVAKTGAGNRVMTSSPTNTATAASSSPTLCTNTPLTAITHTTTFATGIGIPTGLPNGLTATWASNKITISGTPTASGTFSYSIPLTGGCGTANAIGTITATPSVNVSAASDTPILCINTPLTNITHVAAGATSILTSSEPNYTLPPAVLIPTGNEDLSNVTISLNGSIVLNNSSAVNSLSGTIGTASGTAGSYSNFTAYGPYNLYQGSTYDFSLSSISAGTINNNNSMSIYIDYNRNGVFTDAGEQVYFSTNISGPHTRTGTFTVPANAVSGLTRMRIISNEGLIFSPTQSIFSGEFEEYRINLGATNYGLPVGVAAALVANTVTISGTPTEAGTFSYAIPLAGGCDYGNATGTITVNTLPTLSNNSGGASAVCINATTPAFTNAQSGGTWSIVPGTGTASVSLGGAVTGLTAGNVYLVYTYDNGICINSVSSLVMVNPLQSIPTITAGGATTFCNVDSVVLTGSEGHIYLWSNGATAQSITVNAAGDYSVTVTNSSGCSATSETTSVIVNQPAIWYADLDSDGFGDATVTQLACSQPANYVTNNTDCDDTNSAVSTGTVITIQPVVPTICKVTNATATVTVNALTATNATYQWYAQTAASTTVWTALTNNANYAGVTGPTLTITRSTTILPATGTKYRVVINGGVCGNATSATVALQEALPAVAGTITTSAASVCLGGAITYNLFGYVGATIQWQSLASAAATSGTVVGSGPSYTASNVSGNVLYIRAVVTSGICAPAITAVKTIVVNPTTVAGNITGAGTICPLGGATLKLVSNVGNTIQWKYSTDGVNYFNVPTTTVGTATAFGTTSTSGITTTYVVNNVAQSTWFKATVKSGRCNIVETTPVQVVVGASVAGNINVTAGFSNTICSGTATSLTLSGYLGTIAWQKSVDAGVTWTTELGTTATLATGALANATFTNSTVMYRAIVTLGTCVSSITQYFPVTVLPAAKGGTVAVNDASLLTVCSGSSKTLNVTGYVGEIQWQKSTTSATATDFVNVNGAITTPYTFDNITQNTWFRVVTKNGNCTTTANSIALAITVSTPAAAGDITAAANGLCPNNRGTTLTLSGAVGVISWMKSTDYTAVTPTWTAVTGTTTTLSTGTLAVTTAFRTKLVSGLCAAFTTPIVVTVKPSTTATVSATASQICSGLTSTLTVTNYGSGTIQWQKSTMLTGTYTNAVTGTGITTAIYTTPVLTATSYFRALVIDNGCSSATLGFVVKVNSLAVANAITATVATSAADAICTNAPQTLTIGAGSIGDMIQWQYSSTSTTTGTWIDITNATSTTLAAQNYVPVIGSAITPTYFRFKMTNSCSNARVYSAAVGVFYKNCSGPMKQVESIAKFDVVAYPNPYTATFNLSLTTTSIDKVGVMVYDMIGKLIETREVKPSEMSGLQVGDCYPSGVYNVVVTQGEQTKTVRVVKK